MNRDEWMRELEAERVTSSRESLTDVLARLELERPESPGQKLLRGRLESEAQMRRVRRDAARRWELEKGNPSVDRWAGVITDIANRNWWAA